MASGRLGRLITNGRRVRTTSTISDAETADSTNHPVLNWPTLAPRRWSTPKVAWPKTVLTRPNVIMKLRMNPVSQQRGRSTISASTVSLAMVISGKAVIRFVSRICFGRRGRNGRNSDTPAMLNMLPKFSIDDRRLTITLPAAMRLAPWARLMLMIAGSSCGVSPTATAREKMNASRTGRWKATLMAKMAITSTSVTSSSRYPKRRTPRSNSVSGGRSRSRPATLPNSVALPVRTTMAEALPLTTWVPMKSVLARCPSGASTATVPALFSIG
jgi:hypothetical protein